MVEPTIAGKDTQTHLLKRLAVTLSLPVVVPFDCLPGFLDTLWFEQFDCIMLRWVTDTTHSKTRVICHRLDIGLACDDPSYANSRRLQTLRAGPSDEHIAIVQVLHELDSTD